MKKLLSIVLAVLMVASLIPVSVFAATSTGSKITATPGWYDANATELIIDSVEDLWAFMASGSSVKATQTVKLACDLELNEGWNASPIAPTNQWSVVSSFAGTLDGQGYTIRGLYIDRGSSGNAAMFNHLTGTIKNLSVKNAYINGNGFVATFACSLRGGTSKFSNVYTDAVLHSTGANAAGFAAEIGSGTGPASLEKCWFDGAVFSTGLYTSGFVGNQQSQQLTMTDCLNTGAVVSNQNSAGFSNAIYGGALLATNCVNLGAVQQYTVEGRGSFGAFTYTISDGNTKSKLTNCYTLEGAAGLAYPSDMRGNSTLTVNGTSYSSSTKANMVATLTVAKADVANAEAYAGLDFENTWEMTDSGPVLRGFDKSPVKYIASAEDFIAWAKDASDDDGITVRLASNIRVNYTQAAAGSWPSKAVFRGTLDGMGYTVENVRCSSALVGKLYGTIRNMVVKTSSFVGATFASQTYAGAVFENLYSSANILGGDNHAGGIAAFMEEDGVTFKNCWFDGAVAVTNRYCSGILGNQQHHKNAVFINCLNTGTIASKTGSHDGTTANTNICITGISSAVYSGSASFTNCVNLGKIAIYNGLNIAGVATAMANGTYQTSGMAGNVDGESNVSFTNCYVLENSCNYAAVGSLTRKYNANVKMLTAAQVDEFVIPGWSLTKDDTGNAVMAPACFAKFAPLAGTATAITKVVEVRTIDELIANRTIAANTEVRLMADLDFAGAKFENDINISGVFNGNGYTIKNFVTDAFFNNLYDGGVLKNVKLVDGKASNAGVLYKVFNGARIENVYSNTVVNEARADIAANGFIYCVDGSAESSRFDVIKPVILESCWFDGTVYLSANAVSRYASGFIGNQQSQSFVFRNCLMTGTLDSLYANSNFMWAGFSGSVYHGNNKFENCVNMQTIQQNASGVSYGITLRYSDVGSSATIENCYNLVGSYQTKGTSEQAVNVKNNIGWAQDIASKEELANKNLTDWAYSSKAGHLVPAFFADADNKYEISEYKKNGTYPEKTGYVFAGWFTDASCTTPISKETVTGTAYAKFVEEEVLGIYAQIRDMGSNTDDGKKAIRFVSTVDSLSYETIGFDVIFGVRDTGSGIKMFSKQMTSVYKTLISGGELVNPTDLAEDATYFFAYTINNVPSSYFDTPIAVRASWTTLDGTVVTSNYTGITTINNLG